MINLKNFEGIIEPKIVDRGFDYYEQDQVFEVEQVDKGEFCAIVMGSEEYNVFIKLNGNLDIIEHTCDCPYDWGDVCKHKIAVMYYIKDSELYDKPVEGSSIHKIRTDLERYDKNELIKMLLDISKRSKSTRQEVLWELGYE